MKMGETMEEMSVAEIGRRLVRAGGLSTKPLCVHGAEAVEEDWIPAGKIDYCLVKALLKMSLRDLPPAYVSGEVLKGCCPGGGIHLGYTNAPEGLKYFLSSGSPRYRGGIAEHYRQSPGMVEETDRIVGKITSLATNLVVRPCQDVAADPGVVSVMCFGTAEQIRNIFALYYFSSTNVFGGIVVPAGAACATLITYPAGMAVNTPRDVIFTGPTDPTVNSYFPPDFLGVGIPIEVARRMCEPLEETFVVKRPEVTFPQRRDTVSSR